MTDARALIELVRLPAALSVPGDSLAGAAAAGWPLGRRTAALPAASALLYWGGMALNDWADRAEDAVERPGRPIPSGRVTPRQALAVAAGLTAAGIGVAAAAGGRETLAVALPLAATVLAYDLWLKSTPVGPVAMAAARGLDVCLGAGRRGTRAALPAALTVAAHTFAVTIVSRRETSGSGSALPAAALAGTGAVAVAAMTRSTKDAGSRAVGLCSVAAYAAVVGRAQVQAVRMPGSVQLQRAVGAGILGMLPLQAALTARAGSARTALPLAAAWPIAARLARTVSPT